MDLISLVVVLIVVGLLLWLVNNYIPMEGRIKHCLLYTSPSPRDGLLSRMPSSA